jgi:hypothetical protein
MKLLTEYPLWMIVLCIGLGAAYAFFLYYHRERHLTEVSPALKRLMAAVRFLFVTAISFLLLTPLIQTVRRTVEKPVVVIAQDNSESLALSADSAYYRNTYIPALRRLAETLSEKYQVKTYSIGNTVREGLAGDFRDKQTDLSSVFSEVQNRFLNRNLGAVILATDGVYNIGSNPYYALDRLKVPVYTVAMGDTTVRRDLVISRINYNRKAYLGNNMPVEISIDADKCRGETFTLSLEKEGVELYSKTSAITSQTFHAVIPVVIEAKEKGIHAYRVKVSRLPGEATLVNNTRDIFIEVVENREKVLLLYNSPHPDISAIRNALTATENYELKVQGIQGFTGDVNGYDLVILHQVPSSVSNAQAVISQVKAGKIPSLYILGAQSNVKAFNASQAAVTVENSALNRLTDALPLAESNFQLFTLSDKTRQTIAEFPPLTVPFGSFRNSSGGSNLLTQQIGSVQSSQPLICFSDADGSRTGVIAGEGLWKWRLRDFAVNGNFEQFGELMLKTVQYLSVKEEKKQLRVTGKNNYLENEPVQLDAEVYNDSYELVNEPELTLEITGRNGKKFPFVFARTGRTYSLNAGFFPVGEYSYAAQVKLGTKIHTDEGRFTVSQLQLEGVETTADHQLLYRVSSESGAKLFYPRQLEELAQVLLKRDDIKPVSYSENSLEDLINSKWLLILLVLLISTEWFLRKRNGAY